MGSRLDGRPAADGRPTGRAVMGAWMLAVLLLALPASAQVPDSLAVPDALAAPPPTVLLADTTEAAPDSSRGAGRALRRALLLPGWGQLTNGQPEKVPVVVGALAGAGAYAVCQHDRYLLFRHAFLFKQREEQGQVPNEFERFREEWVEAGELPASTLRQRRTNARSSRDIAVLLTALVYTLQALDAYVAAQLDGFDVSEDLSLRVLPTPDGPALGVRIGL